MENTRKPAWLKIKLEAGENYPKVKKIVAMHQLHTICSSGKCPNMGKCWSLGTATFMIGGDICTRSCRFCATATGKPLPLQETEPDKIAESVALMQLKHCVITSVDRDDLPDKGAAHWAKTIIAIRQRNPQTTIEVLIPDFDGNSQWLNTLFHDAPPDVLGHNMETVPRLSQQVRSRAKHEVSLSVLRQAAANGLITKSGIMVGLGETPDEVIALMQEVQQAGCQLFTIGQYLQPTANNLPVAEYVLPEQFDQYKQIGEQIGFHHVESGPLVRSSYMAEQTFLASKQNKHRQ